jgi:hypothetical protein
MLSIVSATLCARRNIVRRIFLLSLILSLFDRPAMAEDLPAKIDACFRKAVTELMLTDGEDRTAVKKLFLKHIDSTRLGSRAVGGASWKNASKAWRDKALDMYFDLLYSEGNKRTEGMKDAGNTEIRPRLASKPEIKASQGYHVVATVKIDNGQEFAVAVLVTKGCKAFDFAQGAWASSFLDANEVDRVMP